MLKMFFRKSVYMADRSPRGKSNLQTKRNVEQYKNTLPLVLIWENL